MFSSRDRSIGEKIFGIFNFLFMTVMILIVLAPIWHIVMASFSDSTEIIRSKGLMLIPKDFTLDAYKMVFKNPSILTGYRNTLIVVVAGTALSLILTAFGAYALSRKQVLWSGLIMKLIVFTMFVSGGMIPAYLLVSKWLNLDNNLLALILPVAISPWNLTIMRTSFAGIPDGLIESARIDGANDFTILFKIVMPVSKSIIAVMILYYGVSYWNSWFAASLYIRNRELWPLQLLLREILIQSNSTSMTESMAGAADNTVEESIKYATIIVATLPILCIYPLLQKHFVKGVMIGSIKG